MCVNIYLTKSKGAPNLIKPNAQLLEEALEVYISSGAH
jgi:hypothetical protein